MTRWLREIVLWTGATLGVLAVLLGIAVAFFGYSFLIFRSGSMGPGIPTGSLALAKETPAADLRAGDVVSVMTARGDRVTHRIVSVTLRGDEASLVLQGDANATPDDEVYVAAAAERQVASVPVAGYVVTVLLSPFGLAGAGCLAGMVLVIGFAGGPRGPDDRSPSPGPPRHRGDRGRSLAQAGAAVAVSAAVVVAGTAVDGTAAFFTDRPHLTTGNLSSGFLAAPTGLVCVPNGNASYLSFTAATTGLAPTGYHVSYSYPYLLGSGSGTADIATTPTTYTPPSAGLLGIRNYTVTIAATRGGWTSPQSGSATIRASGLVGSDFTC